MKVTIIRAHNGWILEEEKHYESGEETHLAQEVFEDEEHESQAHSQASSLANLLWSVFEVYFQSKRQPGIVMEVSEKSREEEDIEALERKKQAVKDRSQIQQGGYPAVWDGVERRKAN